MAIIAAHYTENGYDAALEMLSRIQEPNGSTEAWRAACLAQLGREDEARLAATQALEMNGDFIQHQDWFFQWPFKNPKDLEHLIEGLNKAGVLPD
jgi:predicted RNA polymerase sigma factor